MGESINYGKMSKMNYYFSIILAHELKGNQELSDRTRERVDLGIYMLKTGKYDKLIMSGGLEKKFGISLAEAMRRYAVARGIHDRDILVEDLSEDTVGQLVFSKQGVIKPRGYRDIAVVTHSYHAERTRKQAEFIFGNGYELSFGLVGNEEGNEREQASYEAFLRTFEGIEPGDDEAILQRLLEKHPLYNSNPDFYVEGLKKLILK